MDGAGAPINAGAGAHADPGPLARLSVVAPGGLAASVSHRAHGHGKGKPAGDTVSDVPPLVTAHPERGLGKSWSP